MFKIHRVHRALALVLALALCAGLVGCGSGKGDGSGGAKKNPLVTIKMNNGDVIKLELYPDKAPNTVANFVDLASKGFYDGLIFHRVIDGFMIQGGDPTGTGMGGPGYSIKGEFSANGYAKNDIKHEPGVISMARSQSMDSAGSQFFIMHAAATSLDGEYAAFGKVTEGLPAVDRIARSQTDAEDRPVDEQKIQSIKVDTFGQTYKVETIAEQN